MEADSGDKTEALRQQGHEREHSQQCYFQKSISRHDSFRSSIFSTPTREKDANNRFSRGFAAMSGDFSAEDLSVMVGRNFDPEAVRAAMAADARGRGGAVRGSGGGGGGGGGDDENAGEGGNEAGDGGSGCDPGGPNPYKGKHWSSAAAACVLNGYPPSPKAAAAAAAAAAGHRRSNCSSGGTSALTASTSASIDRQNDPRPRSIWERGGGAPWPRKMWRSLIDPPKGVPAPVTAGAGGFEGAAGGGHRATGERAEDPPSIFRGARLSIFDGCCSCCRSSSDDEDSDSDSGGGGGGGGGGRNSVRNDYCRDNLGRLTRGGQNLNRGGGGGGEGGGEGYNTGGMRVFATTLGLAILARTAASLWAFGQSARAGALAGDVEGATALAVTALVVALSGLVVQAAVGFAYLRSPSRSRSTALMTGAAAFEALGAFGVAAVLASLQNFAGNGGGGVNGDAGGEKGDGSAVGRSDDSSAELWMLSAALASVGVGLLAEVAWALLPSDPTDAARLPYLGAFGSAMIWLGLAALEILIASFLVWAAGAAEEDGGPGRTWAALLAEDGEIIGLVVLEAVALGAMWAARALWTRETLLAAVKGREGPSRRRSSGSSFLRFNGVV